MRSRSGWLWIAGGLMAALAIVIVQNRRRAGENETDTPSSVASSASPTTRFGGPPKTIAPDGGFAPLRSTLRDKPTREDMRERIYRAFGEPIPAYTGRSTATTGPVLDKEYVGKRLRDDFVPMARECYEAALVRVPDLKGKLSFDFAIVGDDSVGGIVEYAELADESTIRDPELVTCMRESLLTLSFEPPPNDGKVTVRFPIELSPDGEPSD